MRCRARGFAPGCEDPEDWDSDEEDDESSSAYGDLQDTDQE